jgi:protein-serine/threonine kinase
VATFANVLKHDVTFPASPNVTRQVSRGFVYLLRRRADICLGARSLCKSAIRKLLIKDEHKRLGSNAGASEIKLHKWFAPINWGLLRNEKPPVSNRLDYRSNRNLILRATLQIVPAESNGVDAINFRTMRDSKSLDFDTHGVSLSPFS